MELAARSPRPRSLQQHEREAASSALNANSPPGRSSRATSGTVAYGSAKSSRRGRRRRRRSSRRRSGTSSAAAWTSGKSRPASAMQARARARAAAPELSRPTGRAPRPASRIDHCAAPQPTRGRPCRRRRPRICSSPREACHMPHRGLRRAPSTRGSRLLVLVATWRPSARGSARVSADELRHRPNQSATSRSARLGRVRAVHEVVRHREREVAADRARRGVGRVRRAHRRADDGDRPLALEHERQRRRRGDEVDELAEERLLGVLGVVLSGQLAVDLDEPRAARTVEPARLEAADDLAGQPPLRPRRA